MYECGNGQDLAFGTANSTTAVFSFWPAYSCFLFMCSD